MAYKTGDIVHIKGRLKKSKNSIFVVPQMNEFKNRVAQIKSRSFDVKLKQYTYQLDIDNGKFSWCDSFFQTQFEKKLNKLFKL